MMARLTTNRRTRESRWERNRRHWEENLDAQNLDREANVDLERDLQLYATADFQEACRFLFPLAGHTILDLGGGLGLSAILFARAGAHVIVADLSLPRLRAAHKLIEEAGVADRVTFIQCSADALPFATGSLERQFTKSVLIHTPLKDTAAELERTLSPQGLACFIEPFDANPFANLYRRLAAPDAWKDITQYFNRPVARTLMSAFPADRWRRSLRMMYFFAFFATPLNYLLHLPGAYRIAESLLLKLDSLCFTVVPATERFGWFGLFKISPRDRRRK
ncbi:methyltransferase domain-containing protein [bacterium]|nr:methyltransferase domain-containing protein [bacterium]